MICSLYLDLCYLTFRLDPFLGVHEKMVFQGCCQMRVMGGSQTKSRYSNQKVIDELSSGTSRFMCNDTMKDNQPNMVGGMIGTTSFKPACVEPEFS